MFLHLVSDGLADLQVLCHRTVQNDIKCLHSLERTLTHTHTHNFAALIKQYSERNSILWRPAFIDAVDAASIHNAAGLLYGDRQFLQAGHCSFQPLHQTFHGYRPKNKRRHGLSLYGSLLASSDNNDFFFIHKAHCNDFIMHGSVHEKHYIR